MVSIFTTSQLIGARLSMRTICCQSCQHKIAQAKCYCRRTWCWPVFGERWHRSFPNYRRLAKQWPLINADRCFFGRKSLADLEWLITGAPEHLRSNDSHSQLMWRGVARSNLSTLLVTGLQNRSEAALTLVSTSFFFLTVLPSLVGYSAAFCYKVSHL